MRTATTSFFCAREARDVIHPTVRKSEKTKTSDIDWLGMLVTYISIPLFILLWVGYKMVSKSKLIPYDEVDLSRHSDMNESV